MTPCRTRCGGGAHLRASTRDDHGEATSKKSAAEGGGGGRRRRRRRRRSREQGAGQQQGSSRAAAGQQAREEPAGRRRRKRHGLRLARASERSSDARAQDLQPSGKYASLSSQATSLLISSLYTISANSGRNASRSTTTSPLCSLSAISFIAAGSSVYFGLRYVRMLCSDDSNVSNALATSGASCTIGTFFFFLLATAAPNPLAALAVVFMQTS